MESSDQDVCRVGYWRQANGGLRDRRVGQSGVARNLDTHPEMIGGALQRFQGSLDKVGLESGPFTPHLFRSLEAIGYPMICMDARRAADAIKSRRIKSDKGDAWALAEMLRTGWFSSVYVKSGRPASVEGAVGRARSIGEAEALSGQSGARPPSPVRHQAPSRAGGKKFDEAADLATRNDPILHAAIRALLESLASIEGQQARLDEKAEARRVSWIRNSFAYERQRRGSHPPPRRPA